MACSAAPNKQTSAGCRSGGVCEWRQGPRPAPRHAGRAGGGATCWPGQVLSDARQGDSGHAYIVPMPYNSHHASTLQPWRRRRLVFVHPWLLHRRSNAEPQGKLAVTSGRHSAFKHETRTLRWSNLALCMLWLRSMRLFSPTGRANIYMRWLSVSPHCLVWTENEHAVLSGKEQINAPMSPSPEPHKVSSGAGIAAPLVYPNQPRCAARHLPARPPMPLQLALALAPPSAAASRRSQATCLSCRASSRGVSPSQFFASGSAPAASSRRTQPCGVCGGAGGQVGLTLWVALHASTIPSPAFPAVRQAGKTTAHSLGMQFGAQLTREGHTLASYCRPCLTLCP